MQSQHINKRAYGSLSFILLFAGCCAWVTPVQAQTSGQALPLLLNAKETELLRAGETLIRELRSYRDLSLSASSEMADILRLRIKDLRPNYLSEVVAVLPSREGLIEGIVSRLADVEGYVGIQYWSKRQETYYDLFDNVRILKRKEVPGGEDIETIQHMEPFSEYECRYVYRTEASSTGPGSELFFSSENVGKIGYSYRGIDAVAPGDMVWMLYAFPVGDSIVFYGVGAVRAFDMFGVVRDRLKTSFLGRIDSFFSYMLEKAKSDAPVDK